MRADLLTATVGAPTLEQKVEFLSRSSAHERLATGVIRRETHMSWVFLAGDRVYKLKKPVHFPYLDFSNLRRREAACRAELRLNRRLAPDVYLDVMPLTATPRGLAIGGDGPIMDWLLELVDLIVCQEHPRHMGLAPTYACRRLCISAEPTQKFDLLLECRRANIGREGLPGRRMLSADVNAGRRVGFTLSKG